MFTYCLNNPICRVDRKGTISKAANLTQFCADGIGTAFSALITLGILNAVSNDRVLTDRDVAIMDAFIDRKQAEAAEKENAVVIAETAVVSSQDNAVYYGVDKRGGTWKYVTAGMDYDDAIAWVCAIAATNVYGKNASWGLYTSNRADALEITVALGGPGPCVHENNIGLYDHFHPMGMLLFGKYKHFHVWYGSIYGG